MCKFMRNLLRSLNIWIVLVTALSILLIVNYVYWHIPATSRLLNFPEPTRFWNVLIPFYNNIWYWVIVGILLCLIFISAVHYQIYERKETDEKKI
jgi:hypothetical protein